MAKDEKPVGYHLGGKTGRNNHPDGWENPREAEQEEVEYSNERILTKEERQAVRYNIPPDEATKKR